MTELGTFNKLMVIRKTTCGVYLDGQELGEILLPHKHIPEKCTTGDIIEVFLYLNAQNDVSATTKRPSALCIKKAHYYRQGRHTISQLVNIPVCLRSSVPLPEQLRGLGTTLDEINLLSGM